MVMIIAGLIFCVILACVAYYLLKDYVTSENALEYSKTAILIGSNMYGTLVLVVLLSYGLVFLPFSIWGRASNNQMVLEKLSAANQCFEENKDARIEFMKEAKRCRNFVRDHLSDKNKAFMDILSDEIPTVDLDGMTIYDSDIFKVNLKEGTDVNENVIAARRLQLKHKMFIYRRKRAIWLSTYRNINSKVQQPIKFTDRYLTRKL